MSGSRQDEYPIYCSWCEKEGILTVVGRCEREHSSGCCRRHFVEMLGICGIEEVGDADQGHE